ncbi:SDR family NAD(P)-dependent oxidoreductase [Prevotella sp. 10(H)]|uniref:SDR family NAD(P)-dependent oxidoreductase n=1 Tax=Prevotella sp. 10(H) TaxID=1158294 RepID=UPI0004A73994|nr:SDR family oxidoreductase [Prevotella sp. 10(H)]
MENKLNDKVIFITGGANGIGKSIVTAFCKENADVFFCDINDEEGKQLCNDLKDYKCTFIKTDVSDKDQLENAITSVLNQKADIDILINNAGVSWFGSILDISVEKFEKVLDTNLRPVFITAKILASHKAKSKIGKKYGRIINMASTRYLMSEPDSEAYAASKGGIVSLTHALANSLSKYNITVNCISPGWIDTGHYGELRPVDHQQHPSNRVGVPEDIARMCIFLCQPENNFINGQNIVIDGGMTKKMIYEE